MANEIQTKKPSTIVEATELRIKELTTEKTLVLPDNYAVGNALKSAWLILQTVKSKDNDPALTWCTQSSIANALLNMCILGLNPAKSQCYFIVYGKELTMMPSYMGKCAIAKRIKGIETEPIATLIYDGDKIEIGFNEIREEMVTKHETSWANKVKGVIQGVYATVTFKRANDTIIRSVVMTKKEVEESWKGIKQKGYLHQNFAGEFYKRTAINRLLKPIINSSLDTDIVGETLQKVTNDQYDFNTENADTLEEVKEEIEENANKGEKISFEEDPEEDAPKKDIVNQYLEEEKKVKAAAKINRALDTSFEVETEDIPY